MGTQLPIYWLKVVKASFKQSSCLRAGWLQMGVVPSRETVVGESPDPTVGPKFGVLSPGSSGAEGGIPPLNLSVRVEARKAKFLEF